MTEPLLTCEAVIAETAFHLESAAVALAMINEGLVALAFDCREHLVQLARMADRFSDQKPDLADLCSVRMSELFPKHSVITIDRKDFQVYRRNKRDLCPPDRWQRGWIPSSIYKLLFEVVPGGEHARSRVTATILAPLAVRISCKLSDELNPFRDCLLNMKKHCARIVTVVDDDPEWPMQFEELRSRILRASNPKKTARSIGQLQCYSMDLAVLTDVRRTWRMRETSAGEAMNDPLVWTLLAKCIVEAPGTQAKDDPTLHQQRKCCGRKCRTPTRK